MSAAMEAERFAAWLDPKQRDPVKLLPLRRPCPVEGLRCWPVDRRVNAGKAVDEPGLTAPVERRSGRVSRGCSTRRNLIVSAGHVRVVATVTGHAPAVD